VAIDGPLSTKHLPANLSARLARWGLVIVAVYGAVALLMPLLVHLGLVPDPTAGVDNPVNTPPSWSHW
jgi:peptide/nickel transport system permease protein